jgi:phosphoserine phosphatase
MTSQNVATLVAGSTIRIDEALITSLSSALTAKGASAVNSQIKGQGAAADIFFDGLAYESAYAVLKSALGEIPIDVIVQPVATRRKKFLLADMESTIIEQEMLDEMAAMLGIGEKVAEITRRGMNGELDFAASLKERTALLAGQPVELLAKVAERITPTPGAAELVAAMKKSGARCWLATGGFTYFTDIVAKRLGFDRCFANEIILADGKITGKVVEPILDKNSKKAALDQACRELNITLSECLTIGDGMNDSLMLNACNQGGGLGVAYHAKPALRAIVPHQINHADLKTLVWAQGL